MADVKISIVSTPADRALVEVGRELAAARRRFGAMASPHEGHSVIREEFEELWEHVRSNTGRSREARAEAIQLAAMAVRYVVDLCGPPGAAGGLKCDTHDQPDCPTCLRWAAESA